MFPATEYADVLVGLEAPDDAAVYALDGERALILTCDFFTPVVDDPYAYGAIAAANAMSDVYAMGGQVALALNIAAFPQCLPDDIVAEILRGGAEKVREAGGVVAGGHTVEAPEPMFGLSVLGFAERSRIWTKGGARIGDALVLTKPLGVGIVTTAHKADEAAPAHVEEATRWMMALNRAAAEVAGCLEVHAATDVTGFALLGHAVEMGESSQACLRLRYDSLPFVTGAIDYARSWLFPAGTNHNEAAFAQKVSFNADLDEEVRLLLFTPETSGGLLLAMPPADAQRFLAHCEESDVRAWLVGEVVEGESAVEVM